MSRGGGFVGGLKEVVIDGVDGLFFGFCKGFELARAPFTDEDF